MAILAARGWLAGTPEEFRAEILSAARWRRVETGADVTLAGDEAGDFIGVAQGSVALVSALGRAGTPSMHLARAVLWVGYGPLLLQRPRVVSVQARTDLWIAVVPQARVLPLLEGTTRWWRCFMALMGEYGDIGASIAADLLIRNSDQRLAATILRFAGLRGAAAPAEARIHLPVTQSELAEASNLSRNSAGSILRRLAGRGLVETDYRGLVVTDPDGLRRFVEPRSGP